MAASWGYYGTLCYVKAVPVVDYVALFRVWDGNHHLYTVDETEYNNYPSTYQKDGIVCYVSEKDKRGLEPLYYLNKSDTGDNIFCVSDEDKDDAIASGYNLKKLFGYVGLTDAYNRVPLFISYNPSPGDHFYTTKSTEIDEKGPIITLTELFNILNDQIGDYFIENPKFYPNDIKYFCPTEEVAQEIIGDSMIDHMTYTAEVFDCDDFVQLLKSAFIIDAYENGKRTVPYCFGFALGVRNEKHATNVLVTSDGKDYKVKFVNPETGDIADPDKKDLHDIFMIMF